MPAPVVDKKSCFVIAPIGREGSESRKRSDQILRYIIDPVLAKCGYSQAVRADRISESGQITQQVIQHVTEDDLVIADLSESNPNVYYELALRHALGKPFVQLITGTDPLPFDVAGQRTIMIDYQDLDSVEQAKEELTRQIEALNTPGTRVETPLSFSVDLAALRSSENPLENTTGEILEMLQTLVKNSRPRVVVSQQGPDMDAMRAILSAAVDGGGQLTPELLNGLIGESTSSYHDHWASELQERFSQLYKGNRQSLYSRFDEEPF